MFRALLCLSSSLVVRQWRRPSANAAASMKATPDLWKCAHAQRPAANKTHCSLACEARERKARLLRRRDSMTHQNELQFLAGSTFGSGRLKYIHYEYPRRYHNVWKKTLRK